MTRRPAARSIVIIVTAVIGGGLLLLLLLFSPLLAYTLRNAPAELDASSLASRLERIVGADGIASVLPAGEVTACSAHVSLFDGASQALYVEVLTLLDDPAQHDCDSVSLSAGPGPNDEESVIVRLSPPGTSIDPEQLVSFVLAERDRTVRVVDGVPSISVWETELDDVGPSIAAVVASIPPSLLGDLAPDELVVHAGPATLQGDIYPVQVTTSAAFDADDLELLEDLAAVEASRDALRLSGIIDLTAGVGSIRVSPRDLSSSLGEEEIAELLETSGALEAEDELLAIADEADLAWEVEVAGA